jgi:hypothetical protein
MLAFERKCVTRTLEGGGAFGPVRDDDGGEGLEDAAQDPRFRGCLVEDLRSGPQHSLRLVEDRAQRHERGVMSGWVCAAERLAQRDCLDQVRTRCVAVVFEEHERERYECAVKQAWYV